MPVISWIIPPKTIPSGITTAVPASLGSQPAFTRLNGRFVSANAARPSGAGSIDEVSSGISHPSIRSVRHSYEPIHFSPGAFSSARSTSSSSTYSSRSVSFENFPVEPFGISSMNSMRSGAHHSGYSSVTISSSSSVSVS